MLPINQVLLGDCTKELKALPDNSIDLVVTDPPYGLGRVKNLPALIQAWLTGEDGKEHQTSGFMSADWDTVPSPTVWREVFRVLKPGGYALVFAGTRTVDLMGLSLRLAGFEIQDSIAWMQGQGFPKGKAALKPGFEPIIMAYKPGKRVLNIDECRIGVSSNDPNKRQNSSNRKISSNRTYGNGLHDQKRLPTLTSGRWPSNVIYSHHPECIPCGMKRVKTESGGNFGVRTSDKGFLATVKDKALETGRSYGSSETIAAYQCHSSCPVALLDSQTAQMRASKSRGGNSCHVTPRINNTCYGTFTEDFQVDASHLNDADGTANASRFFLNLPPEAPFVYAPKASRSDRTCGGKVENTHPTVKPVNLMAYLVRLVTPVDGIVLDPFVGSGSTALGCIRENRNYIGIELSPEYHAIALQRIEVELSKAKQLELDLDSSHTNAS